jgi:RNA recognition motif-containing protein
MAARLFVGNLPRSVVDSALAEFVTRAGFQVSAATVILDKATGQSRGFGFVDLAEGEDVQRAIASLNGQTLDDRNLTVSEAHPQTRGERGSRPPGGPARGRSGGYGGGRHDRGDRDY